MKKGFTLIEILLVTAIILILATVAVPNLWRARFNSNESAAETIVKQVSAACEAYAFSHQGSYPLSAQNLTSTTPRYLTEDYTTGTRYGYSFSTTFAADGYTCIAEPVVCKKTGEKIFQAETKLKSGYTTPAVFNITYCTPPAPPPPPQLPCCGPGVPSPCRFCPKPKPGP